VREEARDWYDGALVDLREAESALEGDRNNWALFAAQQAVEKAIKAWMIGRKHERPPRTNDLTQLAKTAGIALDHELLSSVGELSPYYSVARYPNAGLKRPWESITRTTAERLVEAARRVVEKVGLDLGFTEQPTSESTADDGGYKRSWGYSED